MFSWLGSFFKHRKIPNKLKQIQKLIKNDLKESNSEQVFTETKIILNIDQVSINLQQKTKKNTQFSILEI